MNLIDLKEGKRLVSALRFLHGSHQACDVVRGHAGQCPSRSEKYYSGGDVALSAGGGLSVVVALDALGAGHAGLGLHEGPVCLRVVDHLNHLVV